MSVEIGWTCPNCNSDHVVPDGRTLNRARVLYCTNCYSWFDETHGETVLFESDGGDDVPDQQPTANDLPSGFAPLDGEAARLHSGLL